MYDPIAEVMLAIPPPRPPDPGPFASTIFNDHRTQMSALGEDVLPDPQGRVWFSQGDGYLYNGQHPNHSRVVCLDPNQSGAYRFEVYNIPGDQNEIIGLAYDSHRDWIWVANGGFNSGAHLIGFAPDLIPHRNHFDFSSSLKHQVCTPGLPTDPCYHVYELPNLTAQHCIFIGG